MEKRVGPAAMTTYPLPGESRGEAATDTDHRPILAVGSKPISPPKPAPRASHQQPLVSNQRLLRQCGQNTQRDGPWWAIPL